ncbi:MAG: hypothetical protein PHP06_06020 [Clostridia bacterium]|nr:hypothetical protein [Clostridia bacterium]
MKTISVTTIIMLLIIISAAATPVYAAGSIVKKELIKSSSPLAAFGIGEALYKITYSDSTTEYVLQSNNPLTITSMPIGETIYINANSASVPVTIRADISPWMGGSSTLEYKYEWYKGSCTSGQIIDTKTTTLTYRDTLQLIFNADPSFTTIGQYPYCLQERALLIMTDYSGQQSSPTWVRGSSMSYTVNVISSTAYQPTPTPTPIITPGTTPGTPSRPKPIIIPPAISSFITNLMQGIRGLFGLSIMGGSAVEIPISKPYTTVINLPFTAPDSDYTDGTYQAMFAEWLVSDSAQNIKYESGWQQLTMSPYGTSAQFTPLSEGKYYLIAVVVRQDYTWDNTLQKWKAVETIEAKEVQQLNSKKDAPPPPSTGTPVTSSKNILASFWSLIMELFGW